MTLGRRLFNDVFGLGGRAGAAFFSCTVLEPTDLVSVRNEIREVNSSPDPALVGWDPFLSHLSTFIKFRRSLMLADNEFNIETDVAIKGNGSILVFGRLLYFR